MRKKMFIFILIVLPLLYINATGGTVQSEPEVITLDWVGLNLKIDGTPEDSWVGQQLKEKFPDVRIIPNNLEQDRDKVLVMASAGELPEVGFIMRVHANIFDFYEQGIVRSIPWDMIREPTASA